jgi:uncharacterized protein YjbI with pentapeptide repeats
MPTKEQMETASTHIADVISRNYIEGDGDMCSCWFQPEGGGPVGMTLFQGVSVGTPEPFVELPNRAKVDLLITYVDWKGFTDAQERRVIQRVLDGKSRESWMEGIEATAAFKGKTMAATHEERVRASNEEKIANHAKWLAGEPGGERASWKGMYIEGDDLRGKDLRRADFRGVNIHNADLSFANLQGADFSPITYPDGEKPYSTQIRNSLFVGADLEGANLGGGMQALRASFPEANLKGANLSNSGFSHADFEGSDLRGAKLDNTGFVNVDLHRAHVDEGQLDPARVKNTRLPDGSMHQGTLLNSFKDAAAHGTGGGQDRLPSPSEIAAAAKQQKQPGQEHRHDKSDDHGNGDGQVLTPGKPPDVGWAEWIEQQRKGDQGDNANNDQNGREKGRSRPDEQREKEKEQDRGRGR